MELSTLLAFSAAVGMHWAALVSGVLGFLLSLWFAHRGKTTKFGALSVFALMCFFIAMYQAWRDEYVKNIGNITIDVRWANPEDTNDSNITFNMFVMNTRNTGMNISAIHLARVHTNLEMPPPSMQQPISMHQYRDICKEVGSPNMLTGTQEWKMSDNKSVMAYLVQTELLVDGSPRESISIDLNQTKFIFAKFTGNQISRGKYNTSTIRIAIEFYESEQGFHAVMCSGVESQAVPTLSGTSIMFAPFKERLVLYPSLDDRCQARVV